MKAVDIFRRAGQSLGEAKARTLLTSLAIAVGAFTVTLSLAAGAGTRAYTDRLISSNVDEQLLVIAKDKTIFGEDGEGMASQTGLKEYSETQESQTGLTVEQLTKDDIEKIRQIDGVESVNPVAQPSAKYIAFEGVDKKFTGEIMMYGSGLVVEAEAGNLPKSGEQLKDDEIILPQSFLEDIGYKDAKSAIGKKVTITLERAAGAPSQEEIMAAMAQGGAEAVAGLTKLEQKDYEFTISAVSKTPSMSVMSMVSSMQISADKALEMMDYQTKGTPYADKFMMASGQASKDADPAEVKQRIEDAGYVAQTAEDFQEIIFTMVNFLQYIVVGFGILALIASVFGIINTQYISVLERTQQIGLMKALGMRSSHVSKLFRYQAAWIGLLGGVIGVALAFGVGTILNPWITEALKLGEGNYLLVFEPLSIVILLVSLVVIAIVAGYFPARKAAKLDPIEALRTE